MTHPTDRRKRKNYYIARMHNDHAGLETHIITGEQCILSTIVGETCEGRQELTREQAAYLLRAYGKSQVHRIQKVRGKDWVK